jgi:hypothetical protein
MDRAAGAVEGAMGRLERGLRAAVSVCSQRPALTVSVVATLWALVLTAGLIRHLGTDIYASPGDSYGTVSVYGWWGYALLHGRSLFDYPWGAPLGAGFEQVPYAALQLAVSAPLAAVIGPLPTYNVEILSGFTLTAWVTFLLARRLGMPSLAAAFSALAFTFVPYHIEKALGSPAFVHAELFSGPLLFLVRWRDTGRRWNLVWAGILAGLAVCADPYMGFIVAVMVAAFFVVSVAVATPAVRGLAARLRRHVVAAVAVALVVAAFLPAAVLASYRPGSGSYQAGLSSTAGHVARTQFETLIYSSRTAEYLLPWYFNPLVPQSVRQYEVDNLHGSNLGESTLTLGYTVLALAIVGLVLTRRLFPVAVSAGVGLAGFLFARPPTPLLPGLPLSAPSAYIYPLLPYFRVYARFGVLVMLGTALLAGLGLAALMARLRPGWRHAVLLVPFLLMAVEFDNVPPLHTSRLLPAPPAYSWLAGQPDGILVEYPLHPDDAATEEIETHTYTLYQMTHGHPLFNGATTWSPAGQLEPKLEPYYSPEVVSRLRNLGIRYVFVHRADYAAAGRQLPRQVPGLDFVTTLDGVDIFEVAASGPP